MEVEVYVFCLGFVDDDHGVLESFLDGTFVLDLIDEVDEVEGSVDGDLFREVGAEGGGLRWVDEGGKRVQRRVEKWKKKRNVRDTSNSPSPANP